MLSACYLRFAGQKIVVLAAHAPDCQSREMHLQETMPSDYWIRECAGRPPHQHLGVPVQLQPMYFFHRLLTQKVHVFPLDVIFDGEELLMISLLTTRKTTVTMFPPLVS